MQLQIPRQAGDTGCGSARHVRPVPPQNALVAGTPVYTLDGMLPVEHLMPGDRIISRNHGAVRLVSIASRRQETRLVRIAAGSLGPSLPGKALLLPATQEILLRGWRARVYHGAHQVLAPAGSIVEGAFIQDRGSQMARLFSLEFETAQIIYADGVELASATPGQDRPDAFSPAA